MKYHCLRCLDSGCPTCGKPSIYRNEENKKLEEKRKMTEAKKLILEANEHTKSAAKCFMEISHVMGGLDKELVENANLAFGELMKCIKHLALMQGDITGKEIMPENYVENKTSNIEAKDVN